MLQEKTCCWHLRWQCDKAIIQGNFTPSTRFNGTDLFEIKNLHPYKWAATWDFQQCGMCDQQRLRSAYSFILRVLSEPLLVACNVSSWRNHLIKTHYDKTKKRAHDSQIVRAKENSSWASVCPATDKHQAPTHRLNHYVRAFIESEARPTAVQPEETIAINHDWVLNQACRLSHDIQVISNLFITFDDLLELITKIRFSNNSFEFIN